MQKREYLRLIHEYNFSSTKWSWRDCSKQSPDERLKEKGLQGWELVNVAAREAEEISEFYYYFKRPLA